MPARLAALAAASLLAVGAAPALTVHDGAIRPPPRGATTALGRLVIDNPGGADRLTGASSPAAAHVEVHRMDMAGGVMRMRPVSGGLDVPARSRLDLSPAAGLHLMFTGLKRPLKAGERVPVELSFAHAGRRTVTLPVRADATGARP